MPVEVKPLPGEWHVTPSQSALDDLIVRTVALAVAEFNVQVSARPIIAEALRLGVAGSRMWYEDGKLKCEIVAIRTPDELP